MLHEAGITKIRHDKVLLPKDHYFAMKRSHFSNVISPIQRMYHVLGSTMNAVLYSVRSLLEIVSVVGIARSWNKLYDNSDTYDFTEVKDWDFPSRTQSHVVSSQALMESEQAKESRFRYPMIDFVCSILCSLYRVIIVVVYTIVFVNAYAALAILPDEKLRATIFERIGIYKDHVRRTLSLIHRCFWDSLQGLFRPKGNDGIEDFRQNSMICSLCHDQINISRVASVAINKRDAESRTGPTQNATCLSCPHVFCTACISRWAFTEWSNHRRATCPFCRRPFSMIVSCSQISCPNSYVDDGFSLTPPVCQENFMQVCELFLATAFVTITFLTTTQCFDNENASTCQKKIMFLLSLIPWMARSIPFHLVDFAVLALLIAYDQVSFQTWTLSLFALLAYRDEVRTVRILSGLLIYQTIVWVCLNPQVLQSTLETAVSFAKRLSVAWLVVFITVLVWSRIQAKRHADLVIKDMKRHPLLREFINDGIFSIIALSFKWIIERIRKEWGSGKEMGRKSLLVLWGGAFVIQSLVWLGFLLALSYFMFHYLSCFVLTSDKLQAQSTN